jgi:hypothetical protein
MPDRALPKWTEFRKRTDTHSRMQWQYSNESKPKSERANAQVYCTDDSPSYRDNYAAIDWSDDGRAKPELPSLADCVPNADMLKEKP